MSPSPPSNRSAQRCAPVAVSTSCPVMRTRLAALRYVLEGSVRKAANRVRITGQLVDTATGAHLWADRFDGGLDDIFDLQDQVTESVVRAIPPALEKAEIERAKRKPTESLDAYALYLRGLAKSNQFGNRQANDE